ncbi:MAG: RsmE family RNA methyltransferase [Gemmatimonadales bacterium]
MITVLLPPGAGGTGSTCRLDDEEAHHLHVRRASIGEAVGVRDGVGLVGAGRLVRQGESWSVEIESAEVIPRPADLILAVGAGDRDRFEWLVEKASELGVTAVVPLETTRTAGVATRLRNQHLEKLRRQAREAVKQSGVAWATAVEVSVALDHFLSEPRTGALWLADAAGDAPPAGLGSESVTVVVGPEGGVTASEREALLAAGYHPVRLGAHTLRFETAAMAAAVAVSAARFRGIDG